jgi:hypothetical protein
MAMALMQWEPLSELVTVQSRMNRLFTRSSRVRLWRTVGPPESITARVDRGTLGLHNPKPEERKPRRIAIAVAGDEQMAIAA